MIAEKSLYSLPENSSSFIPKASRIFRESAGIAGRNEQVRKPGRTARSRVPSVESKQPSRSRHRRTARSTVALAFRNTKRDSRAPSREEWLPQSVFRARDSTASPAPLIFAHRHYTRRTMSRVCRQRGQLPGTQTFGASRLLCSLALKGVRIRRNRRRIVDMADD